MKANKQNTQKLIDNLINIDPNFHIKSNIRALDEQVRQRNKLKLLLATTNDQGKLLYKH